MRITIIVGTMCALLSHTVRAEAAPAWCTGGSNKPGYSKKDLFSETDPYQALRSLVAATCYPNDDLAGLEKQVTATRDAWGKKLGLTDADWADVHDWAHLPNHLRPDTVSPKDRQGAWSAMSPLDQLGAMQQADTSDVDIAYVADTFGAKLTQLGRLGYVADCIASSKTDPTVEYAMCATDAAALDLAKIYAEIRADGTHEAPEKMAARLLAYEVMTEKLPKFKTAVAALRAKDPAYDTMFKLGEQAHATWAKTDARWIQLASDLDDARRTGSRKSSAGCTEKTWDAWKTIISAYPAKNLAAIRPEPGKQFVQQLAVLMSADPDTYLVSLSYAHCAHLENLDQEDFLVDSLAYSIIRWPGFRGPRTATQTAILTAGLSLDKRGAEIEYPEVRRHWLGSPTASMGGVATGTIASIKQEGEDSRVTFARVKVTQQRCTKGHYTNRIVRIWPDGNIQYYYQCDNEITETVEVEEYPPTKVKKRFAAGLKPGLVVRISGGIAEVAYPKGKTTPVLVTGVEVK